MRSQILHLPADPVSRARVITERSRPDPRRPRLPDDYEQQLEDIERRSAGCYAEAEELAHQLREITAEIRGGEKLTNPETGWEIRGGEIRSGGLTR